MIFSCVFCSLFERKPRNVRFVYVSIWIYVNIFKLDISSYPTKQSLLTRSVKKDSLFFCGNLGIRLHYDMDTSGNFIFMLFLWIGENSFHSKQKDKEFFSMSSHRTTKRKIFSCLEPRKNLFIKSRLVTKVLIYGSITTWNKKDKGSN